MKIIKVPLMMSSLGLIMIAVLAIMLITGDSYAGICQLSAYLFSGSKVNPRKGFISKDVFIDYL